MQRVLGNLKKGNFFIISAPAGCGKTTLTRMLTKEFDNVIESVSYTTRDIRKGEYEGKDYFFVSQDEFKKMIDQDDFLEYALVYDRDYYGTSKKFVEKYLNQGKHVVLVIEVQGAMKLKNKVDATFIFISPPSMDALKTRMQKRADVTDDEIEKRLKFAKEEMKQITNYDYNIVNDDLDKSYETLRSIFIAEEHKVKNLKNWE